MANYMRAYRKRNIYQTIFLVSSTTVGAFLKTLNKIFQKSFRFKQMARFFQRHTRQARSRCKACFKHVLILYTIFYSETAHHYCLSG